ncbi:hypothetical protein R6Q59_018860 [Mikania micrantha]
MGVVEGDIRERAGILITSLGLAGLVSGLGCEGDFGCEDGSNIIMNVNTCKSITLPAFLTVTDLCRVLEPVILPSASNQAVKQRLLNFFCSLSTVLAFAYCLSSLIQQTQKYFADKKDPSDARTICGLCGIFGGFCLWRLSGCVWVVYSFIVLISVVYFLRAFQSMFWAGLFEGIHDLEVQMEVERRSRQELEPRRIRKERR